MSSIPIPAESIAVKIERLEAENERLRAELEKEREARMKRLRVAIAAAHDDADPVDVVAAHRMVSREEAAELMRKSLAAATAAQPVAYRYRVPTANGGSAWTFTKPQPELILETQALGVLAGPAAGATGAAS